MRGTASSEDARREMLTQGVPGRADKRTWGALLTQVKTFSQLFHLISAGINLFTLHRKIPSGRECDIYKVMVIESSNVGL